MPRVISDLEAISSRRGRWEEEEAAGRFAVGAGGGAGGAGLRGRSSLAAGDPGAGLHSKVRRRERGGGGPDVAGSESGRHRRRRRQDRPLRDRVPPSVERGGRGRRRSPQVGRPRQQEPRWRRARPAGNATGRGHSQGRRPVPGGGPACRQAGWPRRAGGGPARRRRGPAVPGPSERGGSLR